MFLDFLKDIDFKTSNHKIERKFNKKLGKKIHDQCTKTAVIC